MGFALLCRQTYSAFLQEGVSSTLFLFVLNTSSTSFVDHLIKWTIQIMLFLLFHHQSERIFRSAYL